jgi:hypothetical protein
MRRTRFSVTFASGERKVILAYTAQEATDYYNRRGLAVTSVEKGDYRSKARMAAPGERGRLDWTNIQEAISLLGIEWPVDVRISTRSGHTYGTHTIREGADGMPRHKIMLKSWLSVDQMGRTLWHELAHAMQAERAVREHADPKLLTFTTAVDARRIDLERSKGIGYRHKAHEVDARAHESLNDDLPLARAT